MFKTYDLYEGSINNIIEASNEVVLTNELWKYIFKRELIEKYKLRFINIKYGEDYNFIAKYFYIIRSKEFIDEYLYVYRVDNPNSAMNKTKNINYVYNHFVMVNDLVEFIVSYINDVKKIHFISTIKRGFKMTLVVIAKTKIESKYHSDIFKQYKEMYKLASKLDKLYIFHPLMFKFWIAYYKLRIK